jgi:hypothetical protein
VRKLASFKLHQSTFDKLDAIGQRMGGLSRTLVVELLAHHSGETLGPETPIPAFLVAAGIRTRPMDAGPAKKPKGKRKA